MIFLILFHITTGVLFFLWVLLGETIKRRSQKSKWMEWLLLPHFAVSVMFVMGCFFVQGKFFQNDINQIEHEWLTWAVVVFPFLWLLSVAGVARYYDKGKRVG